MKRWTRYRMRAAMRLHGPTSAIFRRRLAIVGGAISVGLVALGFASLSDHATRLFHRTILLWPLLPLLVTPLGYAGIVWATLRFSPDSRGSGIPQVIAARNDPDAAVRRALSLPTALTKGVLTLAGLLVGASTGREGPTVQIAAAVMAAWHRLLRLPLRASVIIAGGAAGVAAAFNTPLAGIAFAIEELAAAYEQRMALLVMTAILISGAVALGIGGDYVYFGVVSSRVDFVSVIVIAPVAGVLGGLTGGWFARLVLASAQGTTRLMCAAKSTPVLTAGICGLIVAALGIATNLTWGTGYDAARMMIEGGASPWWFGPAKFATTLATAIAGLPGGIFAPSLATGAGFGNILTWLFPGQPVSAIVVLGMVAYFTGVVRAPLTAVFILTETTAARGLMLPLMATALIADRASALVCREKLYNGLAKTFMGKDETARS
ncbi:chloride channel protein [Sphingorhabdus soli]|uniref:Chloride channel protein n=1 Tax=Flavisphingopyxis soli TaxID=2601267 RepID=A0A5C6UM63_9SPHN|nr:chloride channel protein [Sphingorhabdus soli]TXC73231.1 chloride channel protein [Sphingorhabdus soli]